MIEQISGTTYGLRLAGGDLVELGDRSAKFQPRILLPRWNNECSISLFPQLTGNLTASITGQTLNVNGGMLFS